jgi:mannose-6-phosphate isomerase
VRLTAVPAAIRWRLNPVSAGSPSACHHVRMLPADGSPFPRRVAKPWGYEIWYALTDRYAGKILHVDGGHRLSLQYHERKDESCYVLSGRLLLLQGTDASQLAERVMTAGSIWRNQPGVIHTIEALEDSDVLEVSTPDLDDVVRLQDLYGREGTSQH